MDVNNELSDVSIRIMIEHSSTSENETNYITAVLLLSFIGAFRKVSMALRDIDERVSHELLSRFQLSSKYGLEFQKASPQSTISSFVKAC